MAKPNRAMLPIAIMFLVIATAFSVTIWPEVSSAAKIAFFCTGVGCGVAGAGYLAARRGGQS